MELARLTTKGQVTIPKAIRETLGVGTGDQILFVRQGNDVVLKNSAKVSLKNIQRSFRGEAKKNGIRDSEDVVKMVKEVRSERQKQ